MRTAVLVLVVLGCTKGNEPVKEGSGSDSTRPTPGPGPKQPPGPPHERAKNDAIARVDFNRWAVRLNLPIYWIADANNNQSLDPDEVAALLFYPTVGVWTVNGVFTPSFEKTYAAIVAASKAPPPT